MGEGVRRSDLSTPDTELVVDGVISIIGATLPERGVAKEEEETAEVEKGGAAATISARVKCGLLNMGHSRFVFI